MKIIVAGCVAALALAACGGGGGGGSTATPVASPAPQGDGAPVATNDIAIDGRNWINYRRSQIGMAQLSPNATIDIAAKGHSEYQRINNTVTHTQTAGKQGFTGATLLDR
ncbi:MAG TPA: CAP domain-containing protein, partial [Telluria sp.]|nr:CAP domain-containing protein [Telluria sp.]